MPSTIGYGFNVTHSLVRNLEDTLMSDLKKRTGETMSFWQMLSEMPEVGDDDLFEREWDAGATSLRQRMINYRVLPS